MTPTGLLDRAAAILRALKIEEIQYSLNGGGDSGEVELDHVLQSDGSEHNVLPAIPVVIDNRGKVRGLGDILEEIVADAPEGDWVNNEGGYGTVWVRPFADDEADIVECDVTFRVEGDYGDDDEDFIDDEEDLDDDPDDDPDPDPAAPASPSVQVGEVDQ